MNLLIFLFKMKIKVMLVFVFLFFVGFFVMESDVFIVGGGGNFFCGFGKCEKEVSCCFLNILF